MLMSLQGYLLLYFSSKDINFRNMNVGKMLDYMEFWIVVSEPRFTLVKL